MAFHRIELGGGQLPFFCDMDRFETRSSLRPIREDRLRAAVSNSFSLSTMNRTDMAKYCSPCELEVERSAVDCDKQYRVNEIGS